MNLQQAADDAMNYLDSVGVAAEWDINSKHLVVSIVCNSCGSDYSYQCGVNDDGWMMHTLKEVYPQKSPA